MGLFRYPLTSKTPCLVLFPVRLLGANGVNPTKQVGEGVVVTRSGEGAYTVTLDERHGHFVAAFFQLGAATPVNLVGYTVVRDTYDTATRTLPFVVYNSSNAAADIIADEYCDILLVFRDTGVTG